MKNWKKVSAAILAAGLITTSAGQVWANENDNTDLEAVNLPTENVNDETVTVEDLELVASIVPAGYTANNIFALSKNLEKISNPKAKTALQKNIDKALAKWEANKEETELPEVETPETETPEVEAPETEVPVVETPETEVPVVETPVTKAPEVKEVKAQKTAALAKAEEKKLAGLAVAAKNIEKNAAKKEATQVKVAEKKAAAKENSAKKDKK